MPDDLRAALAIVTVIAGWALIVYAGYLYYVALPGEHAPRHVLTRASFAGGGMCLVLLGVALLM